MILGITGGSGCGKTTLLSLIRDCGGLVLDCDAIYHTLLRTDEAMLRAIEMRFPDAFEDGVFLRKRLGNLVFSDGKALADLSTITHGAVKREVLRQLETAPALAAIDAIGLFEGGLAPLCDLTVAVIAPTEHRIARIIARDAIPEEYARSRIAAQHSDEWFISHCDRVLHNSGTIGEFTAQCLAFLEKEGIIESK